MKYRFDAFGGMFAGVLAPYSFQGITGKEYDPKSGLMFYNSRWYDPAVGRFTQADAFKGFAGSPASQNPYAYVGNNPINNLDPTGHAFVGKVKLYVDSVYFMNVDKRADGSTYFPGTNTKVRTFYESKGYTVTWKPIGKDGNGEVWVSSPSGGGGSGGSGGGGSQPTPEQRKAAFNNAAGNVPRFNTWYAKGMEGEKIKELQKLLAANGFSVPKAEADKGYFGSGTEKQVNAFKALKDLGNTGLWIEGSVGDQTWACSAIRVMVSKVYLCCKR